MINDLLSLFFIFCEVFSFWLIWVCDWFFGFFLVEDWWGDLNILSLFIVNKVKI